MRRPSIANLLLTIVAYVTATFAVQGTSHFALNAEHYAGISIMRAQPVIAMGILSMVIQGTIFALAFPFFNREGSPMRNALRVSWTFGAFLASYIVLGEAGKYAIPSIQSWIGVELTAAFVQYTLFGVLLGLINRQTVPKAVAGVSAA